MSRDDFIQKVENTYEMIIKIGNRRFTVCDENEKGFSIAEWNMPETEQYYPDGKTLVEKYMIDKKNLIDYVDRIDIVDYTGFN